MPTMFMLRFKPASFYGNLQYPKDAFVYKDHRKVFKKRRSLLNLANQITFPLKLSRSRSTGRRLTLLKKPVGKNLEIPQDDKKDIDRFFLERQNRLGGQKYAQVQFDFMQHVNKTSWDFCSSESEIYHQSGGKVQQQFTLELW